MKKKKIQDKIIFFKNLSQYVMFTVVTSLNFINIFFFEKQDIQYYLIDDRTSSINTTQSKNLIDNLAKL